MNIKPSEALYHQEDLSNYGKNIENIIGTIKVPVGIAGPLSINSLLGKGQYFLPLATTEAALVASIHRGAALISKSGGCTTFLLSEGVTRSPGFVFNNMMELAQFIQWVISNKPKIIEKANSTSRFAKLEDVRLSVEGNHVYMMCDYSTGDAAGQNMVTIATQAICDFIALDCPVPIKEWFVEANASGDKKASAQSFMTVRGKKVSAEVTIPKRYVEKILHTKVSKMASYWRMSALGGVLSGTIGVQGHFANALAALFLACGQDIACVSEASVGITRFEEIENGDLYATVTLPNLIVGTVGGGTTLPSQKACLELMGLSGVGHSRRFAEVCAGAVLAGELSIIGSLSAGDFAQAHKKLARDRK
jgi:hydroxymethylglutaryl-CoA reductase (NADPH)